MHDPKTTNNQYMYNFPLRSNFQFDVNFKKHIFVKLFPQGEIIKSYQFTPLILNVVVLMTTEMSPHKVIIEIDPSIGYPAPILWMGLK